MEVCSWGLALPLLLLVFLQRSEVIASQAPLLQSVESSIKCFEDSLHERYPDQRVCLFKNLVVHNNTIYFVSRSVTRLPQIVISWEKYFEGDQLLQLQLVKPEALPRVDGPVKEVAEAGLFHQQQLNNFYHLFTEIAPTIHYTVCKYLGRCSYQKHDRLHLYWVNVKRPDNPRTMQYGMPVGIKDLFACLTPYSVENIYDATVAQKQTLLLKEALVGLPRNVRFYHQKRPEWMERFQDPPPAQYMASYRKRVADCMGYDFVNAKAPTNPLRITLVNRHYDAGRHILNADKLKHQILELPAVKKLGNVEVNVVYLDGSLREQAAVMWDTSIMLWPHGATMAHTFFLPQGAQALEIVQWVVDDPTDQHIWVQGIRSAFNLQIGLDTVVNNDRTKVFFNYDMLMAPGSQFHRFNDTERRKLLEEWKCPYEAWVDGATCFNWFHWGMSLKLDFGLLRPKLETALANLQHAAGAEFWTLPPKSIAH